MIENSCVENCTCWAIFNMTDMYAYDGRYFSSCIFIDEDTVDCKDGDGVGGTDAHVGSFTKEEDHSTCIEEVKKRYPNANGATISKNCEDLTGLGAIDDTEDACACMAEFD